MESGNDYFGARYLSSGLGRWMTADRSPSPASVPYADFSNPQSLNLYAYAGNNPMAAIDADGHADCTDSDSPCGDVVGYEEGQAAIYDGEGMAEEMQEEQQAEQQYDNRVSSAEPESIGISFSFSAEEMDSSQSTASDTVSTGGPLGSISWTENYNVPTTNLYFDGSMSFSIFSTWTPSYSASGSSGGGGGGGGTSGPNNPTQSPEPQQPKHGFSPETCFYMDWGEGYVSGLAIFTAIQPEAVVVSAPLGVAAFAAWGIGKIGGC